MERLTKAYDDGTHAAADNLPCGENSWNYKELLLNKLGAYEDTGLEPCEIPALLDRLKRASEHRKDEIMDKPMRNTTVYCESDDCVWRSEDGICCRDTISLDDTGQGEDGE